jgi:ABC-2 type transport system permease protein
MGVALLVMFLLALGLTAMSLCVAWPMDSTAGFHAIMMLFMLPMWFLSGSVFPVTPHTPVGLKALMWCNPLTYGQAAFARSLSAGRVGVGQLPVAMSLPFLVMLTAAITLAVILLAGVLVSRPRKDGTL